MNKQDLGDLRLKTVTELGWCSRPVVSRTWRTRCRMGRGQQWCSEGGDDGAVVVVPLI